MKLKHENYDEITVMTLSGELNADELQPFRRLVDQQLADKARDFVLDVQEMEFIDSRGLETLLWLQEQADHRLGQVRLVGPNETVRKILEITRLEHHFDSHDDLDSALKSLR